MIWRYGAKSYGPLSVELDTSRRLSSPSSETSDSSLQLFTTTVVGPCSWFTEIVLCCVSRPSQLERLLVPCSSHCSQSKDSKRVCCHFIINIATCSRWTSTPVDRWNSVDCTQQPVLIFAAEVDGHKEAEIVDKQYWQPFCCCSSQCKLTSTDLPGHSEIHQGLGPYGPGCSYATGSG